MSIRGVENFLGLRKFYIYALGMIVFYWHSNVCQYRVLPGFLHGRSRDNYMSCTNLVIYSRDLYFCAFSMIFLLKGFYLLCVSTNSGIIFG